MSEFGGLRKHEKTQHALAGLGTTALVDAVANFQKGIIKCIKEKKKKDACNDALIHSTVGTWPALLLCDLWCSKN